MSADLSAYMLKVTKGDKESFRFIANFWDTKCMQQQLRFWVHRILRMQMM